MATNYGETVNAFYLAYYGRPADPTGLAFWTDALQKNNGDFSTIVNAFANSPEATARFASVSVADRVGEIYQQLFNRAPEKAGLDFWVEAIESGRLTMANAALEIMHAARNTDAQVSAVRQQVAAQFTSEVEKSGIPYNGDAAVQAARVLISAVTADSKPADIDALIKAGSSLVQTAHDNPAVIAALANGGELSKVLSTAGGQADPVGLVQALASIGKAAVTDSAGLNALLQGGGVSGLLNSLPAGTTLKDVAAAVNQGGLSAGVDAAKPAPTVPADTTPPAALSVQLVQDTGLSATDHVTSKGSFQIGGVEAGAAWQYSLDAGKTWATGPAADDKGMAILDTSAEGEQTLQVRAVDAAGNIGAATSFAYTLRTSVAPTMIFVVDGKEIPGLDTLSVNSIDYLVHIYGTTKGTGFYFEVSDSGKDGSWTMIRDTDPLSEGTHYIRYVATDLAGNIGATNPLKLVMDLTAPAAPKVALANDTGIGATDHFTSDGRIQVSGIEAQGNWEYSFDGKTWVTGPAANADGVAVLATTTNGAQTLQVRSHDLARNTSEVIKLDYTLQTSFNPTLAFRDGANGADLPGTTLATNTDDFWITLHGGLDAAKVVFQTSDTGADGTWKDADMAASLSEGTHYIRDIVTDRAGNTGITNALRVDMDKTAPGAPTVELVNDTGISATDHFTSDGHIKISGIEAKGSWEYSFDAGKTWTTGPAANADGTAILATSANGAQSLQVRGIDAAHNSSAVTTFDFTLQTSFNPTLAFRDGANGADLPGTTLLTNTDDYWVTLHGGLGAAKVVFQISDNKDSGWHDADPAAALADGTYYIRDIITDKAGNVGTTNWLRVDMDKTAPPAPTAVKLVQDTGVDGDGVTSNGSFVVSGLQQGVQWQFSSDGKTWYQGAPAAADGTATGYVQSTGEQTLQVRTFDLAGNTSAPVSLHFTLDNSLPMLGLSLNGADPASHRFSTSASALDLVFNYTGTIDANDSFDYTPMFEGDEASTWVKIDSSMIDTVNKTITLKNFNLSGSDVFLTLRGTDAAGKIYYQTSIDGPYTSYFTQYPASGAKFLLSSQFNANLYLTDGSNAPVKVMTTDASGGLVGGQAVPVGAQAVAVQGVLGAGNDALTQTVNDKGIYGFGTTGGDTLSGNYVWGFGGDDTITATGGGAYNSAMISGGAGADTIHTETSSSALMYASSADSFLVADSAVAHGFDTVYLSNGSSTSYTDVLNLEDIKLGDFYKLTAAASFSGSETGNALLTALETAVTGSFHTGESLSQAALVSFGTDGDGHNVNFLVVDADKDGHVGSGDYVVRIVGSIGTIGTAFEGGMVFINTMVAP